MSQDVRYVGLTGRSGAGAEGVVVFWQPIAIIASIPVTQRCCIGTLYPPRPRARVHRLHSLWPCRSWSLESQAQVLVHLRAILPVKIATEVQMRAVVDTHVLSSNNPSGSPRKTAHGMARARSRCSAAVQPSPLQKPRVQTRESLPRGGNPPIARIGSALVFS